MSNTYIAVLIIVMALVTLLLRFLPFIIFSKRKTPEFLEYLGKALPYAVMAMLVVYCLKDVNLANAIPNILAVGLVVLLHIWKRNTLLSIIAGTVCYMILIRVM